MTDDETVDLQNRGFDVVSGTGTWMNVGPVTRPDEVPFIDRPMTPEEDAQITPLIRELAGLEPDFSQLAPPPHWLYKGSLLLLAALAVLLVSCWYFSRTG